MKESLYDHSPTARRYREKESCWAETCGDKVQDGLEATICTDPVTARNGNLDSCSWEVRLMELNEEEYGPERFAGTLGN